MNLPNYITLSRIAAIPLIIWLLTTPYFTAQNDTLRVVLASGIFILASITDGLDGCACYITLLRLVPDIVNVWVVVLIIGREFLISGLRSIAASEGFTIEASELGKLKMVVQIVSVVAAILAIRWDIWTFHLGSFSFVLSVDLVAKMAIWFMVGVSIISAIDYFWGFWKKIDKRVERRRRRPFILSRRKKKALQEAEANNPAKAH